VSWYSTYSCRYYPLILLQFFCSHCPLFNCCIFCYCFRYLVVNKVVYLTLLCRSKRLRIWEICLHLGLTEHDAWCNFHVWKFHKLMGRTNRDGQSRRPQGLLSSALPVLGLEPHCRYEVFVRSCEARTYEWRSYVLFLAFTVIRTCWHKHS